MEHDSWLGRHTEQNHRQCDEVELSQVGMLVPGLVVARQHGQFLRRLPHIDALVTVEVARRSARLNCDMA